jgi:hypothetical protein
MSDGLPVHSYAAGSCVALIDKHKQTSRNGDTIRLPLTHTNL